MKKGDRLEKILRDIKLIKIQGATNVARAGIKAFLIEPTKANAKRILSLRLTEPLLQNAIRILLRCEEKKRVADDFLSEIDKAHEVMAKKGSDLIKGDMNVFSHCHSSSVIDILRLAKKKRRRFVVYTGEVEPLLQGRKTAIVLDKLGIKVIVCPDLAIGQILKKCDIVLFGADAFTKKSIYNKIGTDTICKLANEYKIPCYACGISMKFSRRVKIEKRSGREVWDEKRKNITVIYPAFDQVNNKLVRGIVSEFGVLKPREFIKKAKAKLKRLNSELV